MLCRSTPSARTALCHAYQEKVCVFGKIVHTVFSVGASDGAPLDPGHFGGLGKEMRERVSKAVNRVSPFIPSKISLSPKAKNILPSRMV